MSILRRKLKFNPIRRRRREANTKYFSARPKKQKPKPIKEKKVTPVKEIYQIGDNGEILNTYPSVKAICEDSEQMRESYDQALKKNWMKAHGYFWIYKHQYDEGVRPDFSRQKRNIKIYAYEYLEYDSEKKPTEQGLEFIDRFYNAVECSKFLSISVSNIRKVLNQIKNYHKGYYFTYVPLNSTDENTADEKELAREFESDY